MQSLERNGEKYVKNRLNMTAPELARHFVRNAAQTILVCFLYN